MESEKKEAMSDFINRARAEAEKREPLLHRESEDYREGFVDGAQWAASQDATDTDANHLVAVSWTDCDCEWRTKYCDEYHRRVALVPRSILPSAARRDEDDR